MNRRLFAIELLFAAAVLCPACGPGGNPLPKTQLPNSPAKGPLRIGALNPRYFADPAGKTVYLAGSHTWNNFQDWGMSNPPPVFDYSAYLSFLHRHSLNFYRLWTWEQATDLPWSKETVWFTPLPYLRTGRGTALDGGLKFDLTRFNETYFTRLRERVRVAGDQGVYVSVMLFNGFSVADKSPKPVLGKGNPWRGHPYNGANNINGVDGDLDHDGQGFEVHTLQDSTIVALEKAYVTKVLNTVGDLDNVLYEVSNESDKGAREWEYEMISFIHAYEKARPKQHPVGITVAYPDGSNADLWSSPADWIAPTNTPEAPYQSDPPVAPGGKVVIADTDHLWGIGGNSDWVWKSFCRGLNTLFMDPYNALLINNFGPLIRDTQSDEQLQRLESRSEWEAVRRNLGYTQLFAGRVDLASMEPRSDLASSRYCLARVGSEYLVYLPLPRLRYRWLRSSVTVDLTPAPNLQAEWFNPVSGEFFEGGTVSGGARRTLTAPFRGAAVLRLVRQP